MAEQITKLYAKLKPLFVKDFAGGRGGVAGGLPGNMDLLAHELSGPLHTGNLTWGRVDKAGSSLADLASRAHGHLTGIGPDDHHARAHLLASTGGLSADHTVSGLTAGQVLRATGATSAAFGFLSHNNLTDVLPDQHHNRQHSITSGSDHTIVTAQYNLVGASATNVVGIVQSSNNPGANVRILRSTTTGGLTLESLNVNGEATIGQSLTAAATAFRVINHTHDYPHAHVVVNPGPFWNLDEQFGLDVDDNLLVRGYIVGKHAIQLPGAKMIVHFDGAQPFETNFTGNATGHMGQVATINGPLIYRPGKFGKAAQIAPATTNRILNPSFETNLTGWGSSWGDTLTRVADQSAYGSFSMRVTANGTTGSGAHYDVSVTGAAMSGSAWVYVPASWTGGLPQIRIYDGASFDTLLGSATAQDVRDIWQRITVSVTATQTTVRQIVFVPGATTNGQFWYVDAVQNEGFSNPSPYCDGSLPGHSWSGTAHASTSSRGSNYLTYPATGNIQPTRGTFMCWINISKDAGTFSDQTQPGIFRWWDAFNTESLYLHFGSTYDNVRFVSYSGGVQQVSMAGAISWAANTWHHVTVTWQPDEVKLYIDGELMATDTSFTPPAIASNTIDIGRQLDSTRIMNGLIDEVVIADRAVPEDEIRAIYESNAPVFAETSTWHWRSGRNRVYADAEGLWVLSSIGGVVLGVYAGDETDGGTKSWGGVTLGANDLLIGDSSRGGYVQWDDSEGDLVVAGQIMVQPGSSGIGDFDDATLDNIADGSTYGRINKTIIGGGYILVGSGTKDSSLNGWIIDNTEVVGQASGLDQVVLSASDGKIYAGQGNVILERTGVRVLVDDDADPYTIDAAHSYQFRRSNGVLTGKVAGYYIASGTRHGMVVHATSPNQQTVELEVGAMPLETVYSPTAPGYARVFLTTPNSASSQAHMRANIINLIAGNPAGPTIQLTDGLALVNGVLRANTLAAAEVSTPSAVTGYAVVYVDSGDGDLKVRFANGTIKTIATN